VDETSPIVLVGFAEALSAPEVLWSLVDAGFRVVAFGRRGRASALRQSHHVVVHEISAPESDLPGALSDLRALMSSLEVPANSRRVLFPLDDTAVAVCSRADLPAGWILAGPQGACADLALNKDVQVQKALEAGFNVPTALVARTAKEILDFCGAARFPVILKAAECVPIRGKRIQGCKKWVCANRAELEGAVAEWAEYVPLLVQPFLSGVGEGVFGLAAPEGVRAWSAHRRLRMMNPQGSGSSACISQAAPEDIRPKVEALIRATGWRGLFMVELLRDHSGKAWFVELNGRPWGSISLCRRQGLEYPAWHVQLALDAQSSAGREASFTPGVVCRNAGREFLHLLFVLRGPKSKALNGWPPLGRTLADVLRVRRSDTWYNWRREDPKVFFADSINTIKSNVFKSKH
jgi:predicted ATP-grasp superfamily ATP-dependent carboligase